MKRSYILLEIIMVLTAINEQYEHADRCDFIGCGRRHVNVWS